MKLEEINNKTNEAFSFLVAALESGESEVLTRYLNAMARFHTYSFGNMSRVVARQVLHVTRMIRHFFC
jgi:DNA-binding phage protein